MKKTLLTTALLTISCSAISASNVESKITDMVTSWFEVETHQIKSLAIKHAFSCKFFSATPVIKDPTGETTVGSHTFYSSNNQVSLLTSPTTDQPLPELTKCLKADFRLTNQDEADVLLEALNDLFASQNMMDSGFDIKAIQTKQGWSLITGEFFDDHSGYVIKTNPNGQIQDISYSLGL